MLGEHSEHLTRRKLNKVKVSLSFCKLCLVSVHFIIWLAFSTLLGLVKSYDLSHLLLYFVGFLAQNFQPNSDIKIYMPHIIYARIHTATRGCNSWHIVPMRSFSWTSAFWQPVNLNTNILSTLVSVKFHMTVVHNTHDLAWCAPTPDGDIWLLAAKFFTVFENYLETLLVC